MYAGYQEGLIPLQLLLLSSVAAVDPPVGAGVPGGGQDGDHGGGTLHHAGGCANVG